MGCVIPNEYQEVEWVQGNGGYINTNYVPTVNTSVKLKYEMTSSGGTYTLFGINNQIFRAEVRYTNRWYGYGMSRVNYADQSSQSIYGKGIEPNIIYNLSIDENGLTIDDYNVKGNTSAWNVTLPIYLFCGNNASTEEPSQFANSLKVYSFKLFENGEISFDLIPCYRKSDNEIGMYDTVSKQFFTNQGTGTFLKGNDVYHSNVFDLLKTKKKIIMNQPHVETLTGDAVSFTTDIKAPLKECKISFSPVQEGSGDSSPTNVRNITGWTGVSVKNGENTYSIDWTDDVGTVYGGYVDLVSGKLVAEYFGFVADGVNVAVNSGYIQSDCYGGGIVYFYNRYSFPNGSRSLSDWYCDKLKPQRGSSYQSLYIIPNGNLYCVFYPFPKTAEETKTSAEAIEETNAWLQDNPTTVVYKLAEPITYQLTPQQILSLKGINNFSCGIKNDMTVKYWKHKLSDSTNIAYEAENLTFDGTNYIDTGVYLFSEKNINRDFEVVIEDLYGSANTYQHQTIVCAKYDSTAIGFLIRLNSQTIVQYNGTIGMKKDNYNNITIKRINGVITIDGEVITNPTVKFTNSVHNHPLVLGCALQDDGTPFRYATGTIGHITVKWL